MDVVNVTSENIHDILGTARFSRNGLEDQDPVGAVKGMVVTPWGGMSCRYRGRGCTRLWEAHSHGSSWGLAQGERKPPSPTYGSPAARLDPSSMRSTTSTFTSGQLAEDRWSEVENAGYGQGLGAHGPPRPTRHCHDGGSASRTRAPIGGLKEKTMAAHRRGITQVLPVENAKDIPDVPATVVEWLR